MGSNTYDTPIFPTWCPGCGDFAIFSSLKKSLAELSRPPHRVLAVYGIGCSGNMSSFLGTYGLHSLHGRAIPNAAGAKLANHDLDLLVIGGDGDLLGEGLNHFINGARANYDLTVVIHNNQRYSLTTGQASPTSNWGSITKTSLTGVIDVPINPCVLAICQQAGLVARGFAGDPSGLTALLTAAIKHPGFSVVEVLQPCVTFNRENSSEWYRQKIKKAPRAAAAVVEGIKLAEWTEETIYTGILYQNHRRPFHRLLPQLDGAATLRQSSGKKRDISKLMNLFG